MSKNIRISAPRRLALAGGLVALCGVLVGCGPQDEAGARGLALQVVADDDTAGANIGVNAGSLSLSASVLNFRERCPGERGTKTIRLSNTASSTLTIRTLAVTGRAFRLVSPPSTPRQLETGESVTLTVRFTAPLDGGDDTPSGTLIINSSDSNDPSVSVPLRGAVSSMQFSLPSSLDFGNLRIGLPVDREVTLRNTGACALQIAGIDQTGALNEAVLVGDLPEGPIGAGDDFDLQVIALCEARGTIDARVRFFTELNQSLGTLRVRGVCRP